MGIQTWAFVSLFMAVGLMNTPIPKALLKQLSPGPGKWARIERLLAGDSVISNGQPKLSGSKTIWLDALINPDGVWSWAKNVAATELQHWQ